MSPTAPPVLLTRVGQEQPQLAATVAAFLETATSRGVAVDIIDVPDGRHSFDILDHTEQSRTAVDQAMAWIGSILLDEDTADGGPLLPPRM